MSGVQVNNQVLVLKESNLASFLDFASALVSVGVVAHHHITNYVTWKCRHTQDLKPAAMASHRGRPFKRQGKSKDVFVNTSFALFYYLVSFIMSRSMPMS